VGTGIPVRVWWEESDEVIATALEVLEDMAQEAKKRAEGG
jgi:hypothetical protein